MPTYPTLKITERTIVLTNNEAEKIRFGLEHGVRLAKEAVERTGGLYSSEMALHSTQRALDMFNAAKIMRPEYSKEEHDAAYWNNFAAECARFGCD